MRRNKLAIGYFAFLTICFLIISTSAKAQLTDWVYFRNIQLDVPTEFTATNYQVLVEVDTRGIIASNKLQSDASDLRFSSDCKGVNIIDHWVESGLNTENTQIWIRFESIDPSLTEVFMFYGNPLAVNTGAFNKVFLKPFILPDPTNPELGLVSLTNDAFRRELSAGDTIQHKTDTLGLAPYRIGTVYLDQYDWVEIGPNDSIWFDSTAISDWAVTQNEEGEDSTYRKIDSVIHRLVIKARRVKIDGKIVGHDAGFSSGRSGGGEQTNQEFNYFDPESYQGVSVDGIGPGGGDGLFVQPPTPTNPNPENLGGTPAGAGYGAKGGDGAYRSGGVPPAIGGDPYGNEQLEEILPGSGGETAINYLGGQGGLGLEIHAMVIDLAPSALLDCSGGDGDSACCGEAIARSAIGFGGGGGSGGGIYIDGFNVSLLGRLTTHGGDGGYDWAGGGGGAGGRIKLFYENRYAFSGNYTVDGGDSGRTVGSSARNIATDYAYPGDTGTFYEAQDPTPEDEIISFVGVEAKREKVSMLLDEANPCEGDKITFTCLPAGLGTYRVFKDGIQVYAGSSNKFVTDDYTDGANYHLIAGSVGCEDTTDALQVSVRAVPELLLTVPSEVCRSDDPITFTANLLGGEWDGLGLSSSGVFNPRRADLGINEVLYLYEAPNGCFAEAEASLIVNHPQVTIDSVLGICENEEGNRVLSANVVGGQWSGKGVIGNSLNIAELSPGIGFVYHDFTNNQGCFRKDTMVIFINAAPEVDAGDDIVLCESDIAEIEAEGEDFTSFEWMPKEGLLNPNALETEANPTVSRVYTLTLFDALTGCSAQDEIAIAVLTPDAVAIIPDTTVCEGTSLELYTSGGDAFKWEPKEIFNDNRLARPLASPSVPTEVTVTITGDGGCKVEKTTFLSVAQNPELSVSSESISYCDNESGNISVAGADTYLWSPNRGIDDVTSSSPTFTVDDLVTLYEVTGTLGACSTTVSIPVIVFKSPIISGEVNVPTCTNVPFSLSPIVSNLPVVSSVTWSPTEYLDNPNSLTPEFLRDDAGVQDYKVEIANINGCSSFLELAVTTIQSPQLELDDAVEICAGEVVILGGASTADQLFWSVDPNIPFAGTPQIPVSPDESTTFILTGITRNPAIDNFRCEVSKSIDVIVNELPTVALLEDLVVCENVGAIIPLQSDAERFIWSPVTGLDNPQTRQPRATPSETTVYTVTAVNEATGCSQSDSINVSLSPAIDLNVVSSIATCRGAAVEIIAEANDNANTIFTWSPSNLFTSSIGSTVSVSGLNSTVLEVKAENIDGCIEQKSIDLVIEMAPKPIMDDIAFCAGTTLQVTSGLSNELEHKWTPAAFFDDATVANPTVIDGNTGILSLEVTSLFGCDTLVTRNIKLFDSINILPMADLEICKGNATQFRPIIEGTDIGTVYEWTPNIGLDKPLISTPTTTVLSTTEYTLKVRNSGNCSGEAKQLVIVNPLPKLEPDTEEAFSCVNETVDIGQTIAPTDWTVVWVPATNIISGNGSVATFDPKGQSGIYTVVMQVTDERNCENSAEIEIEVPQATDPQASRINDVCYGEQTEIGASGAGPDGFYKWEPASLLNSDPNQQFASTLVNSSTVFTVTIEDVFGCEFMDVVEVEVYPLPNVDAGGVLVIKDGMAPELTASGANSYVWYTATEHVLDEPFNDVTVLRPNYAPNATGLDTFFVGLQGTSIDGCSSTDSLTIIVQYLSQPLIPSAFSPTASNGDHEFAITSTNGFELISTKVFNRWGAVVFASSSPTDFWDGTFNGALVPIGGYAYILEGTDNVGNPVRINGTISVVY